MTRRLLIALLAISLTSSANAEPLNGREAVDDVFYQIMPIAWRDSDNDTFRFGDFDGMTASLDYLEDLGITAIWMNPIFPSAAYHGYQHGRGDQPKAELGTEPEFLNFVNQAHARGIKVFVDFVVYGISHDSIWFQDAFGNPVSPYDPYLAFWNTPNTDYLGSTYNTWNGDSVGFIHWDLRHPGPTSLVTSWTQKWLDPNDDGNPSDGIDGYRLDHVWNQYPTGPDGWGYNIAWWETWNAALETVNPDVFIFAEQADWGSTGSDLLSAFDAAFTKPFEFAARSALSSEQAGGLYGSMAATLGALPAGKLNLAIIGDHDVDRLASVIGGGMSRAKAAAAVLLTQPFPPIIYYGDEIGMLGTKQSYGSDANDIPMREPFKWNAVSGPPMSNYWAQNASAFNNPFSTDNDGRSVEEQDGVSGSLLETYRELIAARKANVALRRGEYFEVAASRTDVWSFIRHADGEQTLIVAINLSSSSVMTSLNLDVTIPGGTSTVQNVLDGTFEANLTDANKSAYFISIPAHDVRILEVAATPQAPAPQEIDGLNIPQGFGAGALVATQDNETGLGDNVSELNQMFVRVEADAIDVGLTGNLATDGTGMALFIDSIPGGQNTLNTATFPTPPSGIPQLTGLTMETGFSPDCVIFVNAFGGSVYVDHYALASGGGGVKRYIGSGTVGDLDGFLNGGSNANGMLVAINNANIDGVTEISASPAATATSGLELSIPLADLGLTEATGTVHLLAMILRGNGQVSNQLLPGVGGGQDLLGFAPFDMGSVPGEQMLSVALSRIPGDWDGDGDVDDDDYAAYALCMTGPVGGALGPGCNAFDFDIDQDVDLFDYQMFVSVFAP
jgi:glycosidase